MANRSPMQIIKVEDRPRVLIILLVLSISIFSIFCFLDIPLQTQAAPYGIVSFELAGSLEKSEQILMSWKNNADLFVAFGLGFDFLFMIVYAATISLTCLMITEIFSGWFSKLGAWLGWGIFLAAIFDAFENFSLWNLLTGSYSTMWSIVATWCAIIKFALIILGIIYSLSGWILPKNKIR